MIGPRHSNERYRDRRILPACILVLELVTIVVLLVVYL